MKSLRDNKIVRDNGAFGSDVAKRTRPMLRKRWGSRIGACGIDPIGPASYANDPIGTVIYANDPIGPVSYANDPIGTVIYANDSDRRCRWRR
jgi:hypothetical protein